MEAMKNEYMVIRIACAIATSLGSEDWISCISVARAALEEMREPTAQMLEAATRGLPDWGDLPDDWRKMIDFALEEDLNRPSTMLDAAAGCPPR
jgi:hypothetical protein